MIFAWLVFAVPVISAVIGRGDNRIIALIVLFWQMVGYFTGNILDYGFEYCLSASIDLMLILCLSQFDTKTASYLIVVNTISVFNAIFGVTLFLTGIEPAIYENAVLVLGLFQAIILIGGAGYERNTNSVDDLLVYPDLVKTVHTGKG